MLSIVSREAHWLGFNVFSVVVLALGGNWHWSVSLRNTTQMFPQGEGEIRSRTLQRYVIEGGGGFCCQ